MRANRLLLGSIIGLLGIASDERARAEEYAHFLFLASLSKARPNAL